MPVTEMFLGTSAFGDDTGITRAYFDTDSGKIEVFDHIKLERAVFLARSFDKDIIYASCKQGAAAVNIKDGMRLASVQPVHASASCHIFASESHLFTASYFEGRVTMFDLDCSGNILPHPFYIQHLGAGPNKARQECAHAHFVRLTPDGNYLAVCDLGLDKVMLYPYHKESGINLKPIEIACPPGSGPRHIAFSKCGDFMYVVTEMGNTVLVFKYNCGLAELIQEIGTLPEGFTGEDTASAIKISPDGKLLAVGNRGDDSIAVFTIKSEGLLTLSHHFKVGKCPRDIEFDPSGKFILCAEQEENRIGVYDINGKPVFSLFYEAPSCILF